MARRSGPPPRRFEPAPFDVVDASRQVWLRRWGSPAAASGMAVFSAILRSQQLLSHEVETVMGRHGLTFARYEILQWLATDPDSSQTLSWISRTLRIPQATVTNLIDRLQADRLVRRETHPTDGRTTLAVITAKGRKVADAATAELNETVYERVGLSEAKRNQLVALLAELRIAGEEFDVDRSRELIAELSSRMGD